MATPVRAGEWIEVTTNKYDSHKVKLKGQKFEVERTNVTTGELTIQTVGGRLAIHPPLLAYPTMF
ncbi:hypothetical protein CYANOKiyG1_13140 [Okeania sp. KiyG1]|nr:hypothetical protein CYANOKiyG1_13140 [Okeania sp. KiyG1]